MRGNSTMRVVLKQPHPEMNLFSLKSALEDFFLGSGPPMPGETALPAARWRLKYLTRRDSGS